MVGFNWANIINSSWSRKILLLIGIGVFLVALGYLLWLQPLVAAGRKMQQINRELCHVLYMKQNTIKQFAERQKTQPPFNLLPNSVSELLNILNTVSQQNGIKLTALELLPANVYRLQLKGDYAKILKFLVNLIAFPNVIFNDLELKKPTQLSEEKYLLATTNFQVY